MSTSCMNGPFHVGPWFLPYLAKGKGDEDLLPFRLKIKNLDEIFISTKNTQLGKFCYS